MVGVLSVFDAAPATAFFFSPVALFRAFAAKLLLYNINLRLHICAEKVKFNTNFLLLLVSSASFDTTLSVSRERLSYK
jgi:hypothetical protein